MRYRSSSFVSRSGSSSAPIFLFASVLVAVGALALFQNVSPAGEKMMVPGGTATMTSSAASSPSVVASAPRSITWTVPPQWRATAAPVGDFRPLAVYRVDDSGGDAPFAVTTVDQVTGAPESCLDRATAAFGEVSRQSRSVEDVHGLRVTRFELRGTLLATGPTEPNVPGSALVSAVVEAPRSTYVFQLTGRALAVDTARKAFGAMVESIELAP